MRGIVQCDRIYGIAVVMGVQFRFDRGDVPGVLLGVILGAAMFSTFSLMVACIVKSRERFMGIGQAMTMPLFFASNAIYPLGLMPRLAAAFRANQSAELPGGPVAWIDDSGRPYRAGVRNGHRGPGFLAGAVHDHCGEVISAHRRLTPNKIRSSR